MTGFGCPKCGCKHSKVTHTRPVRGKVRRRRICRHCGTVYKTNEKVQTGSEE